jgi:hypothetical protein
LATITATLRMDRCVLVYWFFNTIDKKLNLTIFNRKEHKLYGYFFIWTINQETTVKKILHYHTMW